MISTEWSGESTIVMFIDGFSILLLNYDRICKHFVSLLWTMFHVGVLCIMGVKQWPTFAVTSHVIGPFEHVTVMRVLIG